MVCSGARKVGQHVREQEKVDKGQAGPRARSKGTEDHAHSAL